MADFFKEEYNKINEVLYKKGYIVSNMVHFPAEYELYSIGKNEVVIDHLSFTQLGQMTEMLYVPIKDTPTIEEHDNRKLDEPERSEWKKSDGEIKDYWKEYTSGKMPLDEALAECQN